MKAEFWKQRWQEGRIGFHQDRVTPLLLDHWDAVGAPAGGRVFVPLCGKTLDMAWLARRGHRVLGVELSELAVHQFFDEQGLVPQCHETTCGTHYIIGPYELIQGDAFALDAALLSTCDAVYDRAALIALPQDMRSRYVHDVYGKLPPHCRGLLITLEYPQHEKQGPPFAVTEREVHTLHDREWNVERLAKHDILDQQPGFVAEGVTALSTTAYRLTRKHGE